MVDAHRRIGEVAFQRAQHPLGRLLRDLEAIDDIIEIAVLQEEAKRAGTSALAVSGKPLSV